MEIKRKTFFGIIIFFILVLLVFYILAYPAFFELYEIYVINPQYKLKEIEPKEKVAIKFSRPISKSIASDNFSITPAVSGKILWEDEFGKNYAQTILFKPDDFFQADTLYQIKIKKIKSFYGTEKENLNYFFKTISKPKIIKISPEEGSVEINITEQFDIVVDKFSPFFYFKFDFEPNNVETNIRFQKDKNKFLVSPKNKLEQGLEYIFKISKFYLSDKDTNLKDKSPYETETFKYKTKPPIEIISASPKSESQGLPQNQEIKIQFNRAVEYKSAENNFSIEPKVEGNLGWEKNTLIFQPKEFSSYTWYKIRIKKGVKAHADDGYLANDFEFRFQTKINPAAPINPKEPITPVKKEGKYIDIDISLQVLTMFEDGKSLGSYLTSTGTYDMPTPLGEFKVLNKQDLAYSKPYDLWMPYWLGFTTAGHGIHELPFWKYKGGYEYKEREAHLGTRISHGCVRLGVGPAERLYRWAEIGTPVVVHE